MSKGSFASLPLANCGVARPASSSRVTSTLAELSSSKPNSLGRKNAKSIDVDQITVNTIPGEFPALIVQPWILVLNVKKLLTVGPNAVPKAYMPSRKMNTFARTLRKIAKIYKTEFCALAMGIDLLC